MQCEVLVMTINHPCLLRCRLGASSPGQGRLEAWAGPSLARTTRGSIAWPDATTSSGVPTEVSPWVESSKTTQVSCSGTHLDKKYATRTRLVSGQPRLQCCHKRVRCTMSLSRELEPFSISRQLIRVTLVTLLARLNVQLAGQDQQAHQGRQPRSHHPEARTTAAGCRCQGLVRTRALPAPSLWPRAGRHAAPTAKTRLFSQPSQSVLLLQGRRKS